MFLENCEILENINIGSNQFLMRVKSFKSSKIAKAGQFYMLKLKNGINILRRPISLHYVDKTNCILEFYYEAKGSGTKEISRLKKGDIIDIQGALGTGFSVDVEKKTCVIIGGGMGIAPTKLLLEQIKCKNRVIFIAGARTKEGLNILKNIDLNNIQTFLVTDDGTYGEKGNVITILKRILKEENIDMIQSCGPQKMLEGIVKLANEKQIYCEVSLEERMACGVKACVGCSIKTVDGMKKVCHDGPVFNSKIILEIA